MKRNNFFNFFATYELFALLLSLIILLLIELLVCKEMFYFVFIACQSVCQFCTLRRNIILLHILHIYI